MRVLTVGNRFPLEGGGGYEAVWRALVAHLRAAGDEVEVLTSVEPGDALPGVHRELPWFWEAGAWRSPGRREARRLEAHALDVLQTHVSRFAPDVVVWVAMGGLPLALIGRSGGPEVALVHDGWPVYGAQVDPRSRRSGWDREAVLSWSCNSAFVRDRCLPVLGEAAAARVRVDPPGIDPDRFAPIPPPARWTGRLALIGRVEQRKGGADAVRALPKLPDARLVVTGPPEGAHDVELRDLAASLGVADRLTLAGPVDDVPGAYAAADAVLFPVTWEEPFGLVPLEAMSVGRPVIGTATGGAAEFLRDGENCLVVPPGEPTAIAAAVDRLAADPALRARLVRSGRETAARYTERAWCEAITSVLRGASSATVPELPSAP